MYSGGGTAGATVAAAVRSDVIQAAQRKDLRRLRALAEDLVTRQRWSGSDLDGVLLLHNTASFPQLNDITLDLVRSARCNPQFVDGSGDTVAHYAVRANNMTLLRALHELLGNGLFDIRNNSGSNLLLTAAAEGNDFRAYEVLSVLEWLYIQGSSLETFDSRGKTGLLWAAQRGSLVLVQWFLARGANLAHRDFGHRTALMLACVSGKRECLQALCQAGAINMLDWQSTDGSDANCALAVCNAQSHFFLGLTLRLWSVSHRMTRKLSLFNSQYGWYYVCVGLANLLVFLAISNELLAADRQRYNKLCAVFVVLFFLTQIAWLFTYNADPGYVRSDVLPSQSYRCSANAREDLRKNGVFPYRQNSACSSLQHIEKENALIAYDIGLVYRQCRIRPTGVIPTTGAAGEALRPLVNRLTENNKMCTSLRAKISSERQVACPSGYASAVLGGSAKRVCLTCRIVKPFRAHHCSDCGHCVHRFDHHCVWVDNCVGAGNQRAFICFLGTLFASILWMGVLSVLYVLEAGPDSDSDGTLSDVLEQPMTYVVAFNALSNLVWGIFVGYLLSRTCKSMVTNITFYEYLKLPTHVVRRFRGNVSGLCWDLRDCTIGRALRNSVAFCTRSNRYDLLDYPQGVEKQPRKTTPSSRISTAPALYIGPAQPLLMYDV